VVKPLTIEEDARALARRYAELGRARSASTTRPTAARVHATAGRAPVHAVVVNYRTPEQARLAVRSLQTSFWPPASIVVVDSDPLGDEQEPWRTLADSASALTAVAVATTATNIGFSAACNLGIGLSKGEVEFVLLVNSDAVLAPDVIPVLIDAARAHPNAGILTPLIVSREEPDRIESAGISFSPTTGRMRNLLFGRPTVEAPAAPYEVTAASGCVMLIRRSVLERVGLLNPEYFFSFEDVDLCLRARTAGFTTVCVPLARGYHEGGRSVGRRSPRRIYFATRNHLKLATAQQPNRLRRAAVSASVVALNAAYVAASADAPLVTGFAALVRGTWHHLIGRYGPDAAA
jgi:GT2 family glycosyltransferase